DVRSVPLLPAERPRLPRARLSGAVLRARGARLHLPPHPRRARSAGAAPRRRGGSVPRLDVVAQTPPLGGQRFAGQTGGATMSSELRVLISKLNPICKRGLETAAALCVAQTHYNVEVEHLLLKLLDLPATDLGPVLRYYRIEANELTRQLTQALEKFD